jgi:N-acetylneuraminate synthase
MKKELLQLFESRTSGQSVKPLFILEMANNHMGDVEHGLRIIREMHEATKGFDFLFAVKFQYRYLDSFVHPDFLHDTDHKLIKRFTETILDEHQYKALKDEVDRLGMVSICTPWDDKAVDLIVKHAYDVLKVPSCYFNDWPLLEKIVQTDLPIIASTAGAKVEDIDRVVSFFQHRNKKFALLHCVGEYPTTNEHLQLDQIDLLRNRYAGVPIGFSTHESPDNLNSIKLAVSKNAAIFEKHVGIKTEKYGLNAYSADPGQIKMWLAAAQEAFIMCGMAHGRPEASDKERADLRNLHRGVYAKKLIKAGERLDAENIFFAMPSKEGQVVANECSKYLALIAQKDISANGPVMWNAITATNQREKIEEVLGKVKILLKKANIALPNKVDMEISHHYGLERFYEWGAVIINIINREYCKKLIVLLPGQSYPAHMHEKKEETMQILFGDMTVKIKGEEQELNAGDLVVVERGTMHSFKTNSGLILEEISTTYYQGDSHWEDESIGNTPNRKILLTYWTDFFNS